jgi:CxxC-x17-CxxC domain-containing protein
MDKDEVLILGQTNFRNQQTKFGIKNDDRTKHIYVVGKTGTGKTVLLENMAIQDIQNNCGVAIVDPHGEFAEKMLDFVPSNRINDVVYFNPADLDYPLTFNIMEQIDPEYRYLVASGLMGVFKKIWPDVWSARMEYILRNAILALLEYPGSTLLGINRLLADKDFRQKVVEKITDPGVKAFWNNEFAKYPDRFREEAVAPIQNKVGQFISTPLIRNIIGQVKSSIDMREVMDKGKILVANLSKGKIGEDASQLLGALVVTRLQLAAMGRADIPEGKRKDFYLYVDEFQDFSTDAFATILSEARKYHLCLTLAHQYIAQLDSMTDRGKSTKVKDAIFGNVGTIIIFRVGATDAEFLEKEFSPVFTIDDLVNLPNYNIYLKLMINGVASRPFSASTLAPVPKLEKSFRDKIIKASRERYTMPRKKVEEKIARWSEAVEEFDEKKKFDTICSGCGKKTKVAFEPDGVRPVYCSSCLQKERERKTELTKKQKFAIDLEGVREAIKKAVEEKKEK